MTQDDLETRLARAQAELKLFRSVFDAIPDFIGLQDRDHRIVRYNEAAYRFLDLRPEQVQGRRCFELIGNRRPCRVCATSQVYQTLEPAQVDRYFEELDRWLDVRAYPILDDRGELVYVIEHLRDITERRRTEEQERQHAEDIAFLGRAAMALVEFPTDGDLYRFIGERIVELVGPRYMVAVSDFDQDKSSYSPRHILGIGDALERVIALLGGPPEDLRGTYPEEVQEVLGGGQLRPIPGGVVKLASQVMPRFAAQGIRDLLGLGNAWAIGFVKGDTIYGGVTVVAPQGAPPPRAGVVEALVRQVAVALERQAAERDKARLEEQLLHAQKMEAVGRLAGGIAHDFNNILTGILGNATLALMDAPEGHPTRMSLEEIELSARRAAALVRQLLVFSRRQVIAPRVVEPGTLLERMVGMLSRLVGEHIAVRTEAEDDLPAIRVDPGQLEQVLVNLVVNARDAMPDGGELALEVERAWVDPAHQRSHPEASAGSHVCFTVRDTGSGMDSSTLSRIYEPFFTTKPSGEGTGLGLSLVYGAVRQNGGHIAVDSTPGQGTTFRVYLPAESPGALDADDSSTPVGAMPRGAETVLVVEDEEPVRELICKVLRRVGYLVLEANDVEHAQRLAAEHPSAIHLLLTDVVMPVLTGDLLAARVRALRPDIRVLFTSGYTGRVLDDRGLQDSEVHLLRKPFTPQALATRVRAVLDERG